MSNVPESGSDLHHVLEIQCDLCEVSYTIGLVGKMPSGWSVIHCPYCSDIAVGKTDEIEWKKIPSIEEALRLARIGMKVSAIKEYRVAAGIGLKEAKDFIESTAEWAEYEAERDAKQP